MTLHDSATRALSEALWDERDGVRDEQARRQWGGAVGGGFRWLPLTELMRTFSAAYN
ncbi:MAG: hypothetical protein ACRD9R_20490 [Pyrinomonadaceae bacterium]